MAHINAIYFHHQDIGVDLDVMTVHVTLRPSGTVQVKAKLPASFYRAVVEIAQTAADHHEALMRAEILGDNHTTTKGENDE